ncbi:cutinase family protein [Mycobacterium sp. CVI_P3]|uniref:Cutinase n=1 Tax=Mycobacterium pinniadriaticum TaxID=2994102 RepID=A0ABT3SDV0_9MYCO|nr:cutinase family protein [Mycobacterium pinniadriaticum]MCX2931090.1 cutinase family protein [Mycobacterium pinniadriaticum]MCX2937686.1 cutinase family protein [Mycobacterium pinniadriaticum]
MRPSRTATRAVALLVAAAAMLLGPSALPGGASTAVPRASAASCPDVEVIFARGRLESPGTGIIGNDFVRALRSKVAKNIGVYAVNYPADSQVDIGANDISRRVLYNMNNCPNTRLVLGGYSLGAAAADMVLALPISILGFKTPLPAGADSHIAAVALFGNGTQWLGPITNFNPVFGDRTIELCHGDDPICNPADPDTWEANWPDHLAAAYQKAGMINQAADFVAGKL